MAANEIIRMQLTNALDHALAGRWDAAHAIVQNYEDSPLACWLHAVVHKIEGDPANARYWYARTDMNYDRFDDPNTELRAIQHQLAQKA